MGMGGPEGNIKQISKLFVTLRAFLNGKGAEGKNLTNFKLVYHASDVLEWEGGEKNFKLVHHAAGVLELEGGPRGNI